jgi:hypothetical protein
VRREPVRFGQQLVYADIAQRPIEYAQYRGSRCIDCLYFVGMALSPGLTLLQSHLDLFAFGNLPIDLEQELPGACARELPATLDDDFKTCACELPELAAPGTVLLDRFPYVRERLRETRAQ